MKQILFICTGNYYRSRFAEECFNHIAGIRKKNWRADSRGLAQDMNKLRNPGTISKYAVSELEKRLITANSKKQFPRSLDRDELESYQVIIALDETEHRPMVETLFPEIKEFIRYWNIKDIEESSPEKQMELLYYNILKLTDEL